MYLHAETLSMIEDALLLMEAAKHFMRLDPAPVPDQSTADSTGGHGSTRAPVSPHRMPSRDPWNQPGE